MFLGDENGLKWNEKLHCINSLEFSFQSVKMKQDCKPYLEVHIIYA